MVAQSENEYMPCRAAFTPAVSQAQVVVAPQHHESVIARRGLFTLHSRFVRPGRHNSAAIAAQHGNDRNNRSIRQSLGIASDTNLLCHNIANAWADRGDCRYRQGMRLKTS